MLNTSKFRQLLPEKIHSWREEKKEFFLIDTLTNERFTQVHLPGAQNACVFEVTFLDQVKNITEDKNARIVLYGSSHRSMDASVAAEKLDQAGYKNLCILKGGVEGWRSEGLSLQEESRRQNSDPQTFLQLEQHSYIINPQQSSIVWTGRNANSNHFGTIAITKGALVVEEANIAGDFEIDMNSITNTNLEGDELQPVLISHLQSDDFFFTSLFPVAKYEITHTTQVNEPYLTSPNHEIHGTLALRGVKAAQDFMATVNTTSQNELIIEAHFDIDRTRWNIIYGSTRFFEHLGMHQVSDMISIQLRLLAS